MAITHKTVKDKRIDIRINGKQKMFFTHMAKTRHKKLSAFILDCAYAKAEEMMSEKNYFQMPEKQWLAFCAALDAPTRELPRVKELFREKTIFDE